MLLALLLRNFKMIISSKTSSPNNNGIQVNFGTLDSSVPSFEAWKGTTEDADYDASSSETISISIPPIGAGFFFIFIFFFQLSNESKFCD